MKNGLLICLCAAALALGAVRAASAEEESHFKKDMKQAGRDMKAGAVEFGRGMKGVAKNVGHGAKKVGKEVGQTAKRAPGEVADGFKTGGKGKAKEERPKPAER